MKNGNSKKTVLSGIQPSGELMIGNYIGSLQNCIKLQKNYTCLFPLVDLHALNIRREPELFRERCYEFVALYLACGLDPEKGAVFIQSHVPGHAQLAAILTNYIYVGELNRMTQYKEKARKQSDNINAGLYSYPVLMAADILLYHTNLVPVGADQGQHLELTRVVAKRFNNQYGPTFTVPEVYFPPVGARIMSLQEPAKKMSKSDTNTNNYIALLDTPDVVKQKIARAVTDSENSIVYDPERKPGISNLITILAAVTNASVDQVAANYRGIGYASLKADVIEAVNALLAPVQARYREINKDKSYIDKVLRHGARQAVQHSGNTLKTVNEKIGLITRGDESEAFGALC